MGAILRPMRCFLFLYHVSCVANTSFSHALIAFYRQDAYNCRHPRWTSPLTMLTHFVSTRIHFICHQHSTNVVLNNEPHHFHHLYKRSHHLLMLVFQVVHFSSLPCNDQNQTLRDRYHYHQ